MIDELAVYWGIHMEKKSKFKSFLKRVGETWEKSSIEVKKRQKLDEERKTLFKKK